MKFLLPILLLCASCQLTLAQETVPAEQEFLKLKQEYDGLMEQWWKKSEELQDDKEAQQRFFEQSYPAHVMTQPFFQLEEQYRGTNVGLSCLHQMISAAGAISSKDDLANLAARESIELVTEHYLDHPDIDLILPWVWNRDWIEIDRFLDRLVLSSNPKIRGQARFVQAKLRGNDVSGTDIRKSLLNLMGDDAEFADRRKALLEFQESKSAINLPQRRQEALALIDEIKRDYADVPEPRRTPYGPLLIGKPDPKVDEFLNYPRGTIGTAAANLRSELVDFGIGRTPPDFAAIDVAGEPRRLHDYRGKTLLLMFSFKGCGPCEAMYPHLRELIQRYPADSFAILGIMHDETIEPVKEAIADGTITWPCIHDGATGPIISRWNITSYPGIYVLDREGVIRFIGPRDKLLDRAIEVMMQPGRPDTTDK